MTHKYKQWKNFNRYTPEVSYLKVWSKTGGKTKHESVDAETGNLVTHYEPEWGWVVSDEEVPVGAIFTKSECDTCWYDIQMKLEDEKDKFWLVQYLEENGFVMTWSRSSQFILPIKGQSVVQVPNDMMPIECVDESVKFKQRLDHFWLWDDEAGTLVRNWPELNKFKAGKISKLIMKRMPELQYAVDTRQASAEETQEYAVLMEYKLQIARLDLSSEVIWPDMPEFLAEQYEGRF